MLKNSAWLLHLSVIRLLVQHAYVVRLHVNKTYVVILTMEKVQKPIIVGRIFHPAGSQECYSVRTTVAPTGGT